MTFDPKVDQEIEIEGIPYRFAGNPIAPDIPYGQEGRAAIVFKLTGENEQRALKVFKGRFRVPSMVSLSARLATFSELPGLTVCRRSVLTSQNSNSLLRQYPDLSYAVVMPWIEGPTWFDILSNRKPLTKEQSHRLAYSFASILSRLEQQGTAHCDLSSANLILPTLAKSESTRILTPIELVDVEGIYARSLDEPEVIPIGTDGYAHHEVRAGKIWNPLADRFSGAILLAEMLGSCDPIICKSASGDSYFSQNEIQRSCPRYDSLVISLQKFWGKGTAQLLKRVWESDMLADCPTFDEWLLAMPEQASKQITLKAQAFPEQDSEIALSKNSSDVEEHLAEVFPGLEVFIGSSAEKEKSEDENTEIIQLDPLDEDYQSKTDIEGQILKDLDRPKESKKPAHSSVAYYAVCIFALVIGAVLLKSLMSNVRNISHPIEPPIPSSSILDASQNSPTQFSPTGKPTLTQTLTPTSTATRSLPPSVTPTLGLSNLTEAFSSGNISRITRLFTLGEVEELKLLDWINHGLIFSKSNHYIGQVFSQDVYNSFKGQIFDLKTRKLIREIDSLDSFSFSPNENTLAYVNNGRVTIEDITTQQEIQSLPIGYQFVDFVTDDQILIDYGGNIAVVNLHTNKQEKAFITAGKSMRVRVSPNGELVATLGENDSVVHQLQVWDFVTDAKLYQTPVSISSDFIFSADNKYLIIANDTSYFAPAAMKISKVDLSTGQVVSSFDMNTTYSNHEPNSDSFPRILISQDQSMIIFTLSDTQVNFYDFVDYSLKKILTFENPVSGLELSPDGKILAVSSKGQVFLYGIGY